SEPVEFAEADIREVLSRPGVLDDLSTAEDSPADTVEGWAELIPTLLIASGAEVDRVVGPGDIITDDRPLTEYFLLRRMANRDAVPMEQETISQAFGAP
ncbi:MAG: hypothetical protein MUC54_09130, partial [Chloroflexi bacterium]|nr:hypothetical protein [Chloroflexota bacterium]